MSGTSSGGRASVQTPTDVIMIDPDSPNNNASSEPETQQPTAPGPAQNVPPPVIIGEPADGYSIHQSIIISHNYYEKKILSDGTTRGKCLVCWKDKNKENLFKMPDGNLRGKKDHCKVCQSFTDGTICFKVLRIISSQPTNPTMTSIRNRRPR